MAVNTKFLVIPLMILSAFSAAADTIVLKSGKRVEVDMAWEENDQVKGTLSGVSLAYPQSAVERIERSKDESLTSQKEGFKFDVWYSGMTVSDVRHTAEENKITLQQNKLNINQTGTDDSAAGKNSQAGTKIYYDEQLLDNPATIELVFTPVSEKLYILSIRWTNIQNPMNSEFSKKVISNLFNSYGKPAKEEATIFNTTFIWPLNKYGNVELRLNTEAVEIKYLDSKIEKLAQEEIQAKK